VTAEQVTGHAVSSSATRDDTGRDMADPGDGVLSAVTTTAEAGALPEATYLLVAGGLVCVVLRLAIPGLGALVVSPAVVLLAMGGAGLVVLPVGGPALLLLGFALAALCLEVMAFPGLGLHAVGGGLSLLLAGLYLHEETFAAHLGVVIPAAVGTGVITFIAGRHSWRYIKDQPLHRSGRLVGRRVFVLTADGATGAALLTDRIWDISSADGPLHPGQPVRVAQAFDDWLLVETTHHGELP
jgi:membrane-bound ClpP family serine protease